jgi:large subunit ribosomal protein L25
MKHEKPKIEAERREKVGTVYSKRLRKVGRLPAIIYGHKKDPVAVSIDEKEILTHLHHGTHVLDIAVKGGGSETVLVKDLQFGHLGDNVLHVDFARVDLEEEVTVLVNLAFSGTSKAAAQAGAILSHDMTSLEVVCRVNAIPGEIPVDLTIMGEGTVITVAEIELPTGVRAAVEPETVVTHISFVKKEEEAVGEEAEVAPDGSEPEVITEAKAEDGDGDKKKESKD